MKRTLVALAFAAVPALASPARAVTLEVLRRDLPPGVKITDATFTVDEKAGRVRVVVDTFDEAFEGSWSTERVEVPGLVFDARAREILYEGAGPGVNGVTCAVRKKVLFSTVYTPTPACRFSVEGSAEAATASSTTAIVRLTVAEPSRTASLAR